MMSAIAARTVGSIISYIVQDTCISVAHVSSRLRFDTFFTFILSFENGISYE